MATADLREELECSICLNIYTYPVILKCGHNFCQLCIETTLNTQEAVKVYTCPECRAEFLERPLLQRNLKLCNIVEHFQTTQPEQNLKEVEFCSYCILSPVPAAKTCLLCEASLCEKHLKNHSNSPQHILIEPTTSLKNMKCTTHKEPFMYYCSEDAACICVTCCVDGDHKGHQVELLKETFKKKKEVLRNLQQGLTSKREETENRVQSLQEHQRKVQEKAAGVALHVTALFSNIKEQLEDREKQVLSEIARQEKQATYRICELIQQLEVKLDVLSVKIGHIEELCKNMDPMTVLQGEDSEKESDIDSKEGDSKQLFTFEDLDEIFISVMLQRDLTDIVTFIKAVRGFNMQATPNILLDVNTAFTDISLSSDLKTANKSKIKQHSVKSGMFIDYSQVLSIESFSSGRHYLEVETSELESWRVGMAYPSIEREGKQSGIGYNSKSWCVFVMDNKYVVRHNSVETKLLPKPFFQRLGIYLDYEAGRLSFYELCDPIRHLHTFSATFTEPLHAAFWVFNNAWIRIRT